MIQHTPRPLAERGSVRDLHRHECGAFLRFDTDHMGVLWEQCDRCRTAHAIPRHPPYAEDLAVANSPGWRGPSPRRRR